ncbi:MAG: LysM peptidoglycan-binding domain-containing protein [Candidatus Saccharibacteria bacterium]|nr:LysM peptidoglycan-binding domain-containing protein [Candidatus Saccharibacteria bacterium]
MTKKSTKNLSKLLRESWTYILMFAVIFGVVFTGSRNKTTMNDTSLDMERIVANNSYVTLDQLSEFYTTASVAETINLATASVIRNNYESVSIMQDIGQSEASSSKVVKPVVIDVSHLARGVVTVTVAEGDTMESIAAKYGVTTTQIRWSNKLKNETVNVGQTLLVPTYPGIAYTVKSGDTFESVAEKYKSNVEEIRVLNDLEDAKELTVGAVILLPGGELPEKERPEYVAPNTSARTGSSYTTYRAAYASGNRYAYGWCTWYAWQWRHDHMPSNYDLPSNMGNARNWARAAASAGFSVNKTPQAGDVFVSGRGYYGHVGIVTSVNSDGTITISDMNGVAGWGRVGSTTVDRGTWSSYSFIHGR